MADESYEELEQRLEAALGQLTAPPYAVQHRRARAREHRYPS